MCPTGISFCCSVAIFDFLVPVLSYNLHTPDMGQLVARSVNWSLPVSKQLESPTLVLSCSYEPGSFVLVGGPLGVLSYK